MNTTINQTRTDLYVIHNQRNKVINFLTAFNMDKNTEDIEKNKFYIKVYESGLYEPHFFDEELLAIINLPFDNLISP